MGIIGKVSLGGNFNFWAQWRNLILSMGNTTERLLKLAPP